MADGRCAQDSGTLKSATPASSPTSWSSPVFSNFGDPTIITLEERNDLEKREHCDCTSIVLTTSGFYCGKV
jgi:hypothetical protein